MDDSTNIDHEKETEKDAKEALDHAKQTCFKALSLCGFLGVEAVIEVQREVITSVQNLGPSSPQWFQAYNNVMKATTGVKFSMDQMDMVLVEAAQRALAAGYSGFSDDSSENKHRLQEIISQATNISVDNLMDDRAITDLKEVWRMFKSDIRDKHKAFKAALKAFNAHIENPTDILLGRVLFFSGLEMVTGADPFDIERFEVYFLRSAGSAAPFPIYHVGEMDSKYERLVHKRFWRHWGRNADENQDITGMKQSYYEIESPRLTYVGGSDTVSSNEEIMYPGSNEFRYSTPVLPRHVAAPPAVAPENQGEDRSDSADNHA